MKNMSSYVDHTRVVPGSYMLMSVCTPEAFAMCACRVEYLCPAVTHRHAAAAKLRERLGRHEETERRPAMANPSGPAVLTDSRSARGPEQAAVKQTTTRPGSRLRAHGANPHAPGAQGIDRSGDARAAAGPGIRICGLGRRLRICGLGRRLRICGPIAGQVRRRPICFALVVGLDARGERTAQTIEKKDAAGMVRRHHHLRSGHQDNEVRRRRPRKHALLPSALMERHRGTSARMLPDETSTGRRPEEPPLGGENH